MNKFLATIVFSIALLAVATPALACNTAAQQPVTVVTQQPTTAQQTAVAAFTNPGLANTASTTTQSTQSNTMVVADSNQQQNVVPQGPNLTVADTTQGTLAVIDNTGAVAQTINNTVNQQNKVFLGPEPTPTPTPAPTPRIKTNDFVAMLITDGLAYVRPGEKFTYLVKMRNNLPNDVRISTLRVHIPAFVIPKTDTIRGHEDLGAEVTINPASRTIDWHDFTISADAEITFALDAEVEAFAPNGVKLVANAQMSGDGVSQFATDETFVYRLEAIAATQTAAVSQAPVMVQPARPAVPVTATTGANTLGLVFAPISTLMGGLGLRRILRKS